RRPGVRARAGVGDRPRPGGNLRGPDRAVTLAAGRGAGAPAAAGGRDVEAEPERPLQAGRVRAQRKPTFTLMLSARLDVRFERRRLRGASPKEPPRTMRVDPAARPCG